MALLPHPEHEIARRITELESRAWPDVMIWKPASSISGQWEALGDGWEITEASPVKFADALEKRLAPAPGGSPAGGKPA